MATTAITPVMQAINTRSVDLLGVGTVADTPSDGWAITPPARANPGAMCLIFEADATGDTVTIAAGDNPPSRLSGSGSIAIVLAASDIRAVWIEPGRFIQSDGTLLATCVDAGTKCYVIVPPLALGGGTLVA